MATNFCLLFAKTTNVSFQSAVRMWIPKAGSLDMYVGSIGPRKTPFTVRAVIRLFDLRNAVLECYVYRLRICRIYTRTVSLHQVGCCPLAHCVSIRGDSYQFAKREADSLRRSADELVRGNHQVMLLYLRAQVAKLCNTCVQ